MFEISRRHTPVFVVSEARKLAHILTQALQLHPAQMAISGLEILDISQTIRINEVNEFIVKSSLSLEAAISTLRADPSIQQLRTHTGLMEELVRQIVAQLEVDSYVCTWQDAPISVLEKLLPRATQDSKKPLMVFATDESIDYTNIKPKWLSMDHLALWIGQDWTIEMKETEAFFAMAPAIKLEIERNRYQSIEWFGNFAAGMVRL